ncbi:MAG: bifunctional pyr operon transcriptional regulator/uracil phosphoribosyltransferase PyrR [Proteobacteria bacterium]|nr:MAG: bifunctional pyr operon transcriptional regulator/uracil phosphoribosyltransferase PyrR [Pseudomonadota bacterium]
MAAELRPMAASDPVMIGIHTGGAWLAERLHAMLELESQLCSLDITFYRDDFSTVGLHPQVKPSHMPEDVENRHVILVDDVLQTGRTVRAALNEIFSYGRPKSVRLAVLVDRGLRELPVHADVCGLELTLDASEQIKLTGPGKLELKVTNKND